MSPANQMTRTSWIAVSILLLFAFGIRVAGITYGLPFSQSEKEQRSVNTALKMAATKNIDPQQVGKGIIWYVLLLEFGADYLFGRMTGRFSSPFDFAKDFFLDHTELYLIDRLNQILMALLSLWFLYRLCRRLFGERGGIWALAFGACSAAHVDISHHASEDMLVVLFGILTMERAVAYDETQKLQDLILAGLFAAVAASAKITGGIALMSFLPILVRRREWGRILPACLCFGIFYVLLNPYLFISFKESLESFSRDAALRHGAVERQGFGTTLTVIGGQLLGYPLGVLVLVGIGVCLPPRKLLFQIAFVPLAVFLLALGHGWGIGPLYAMAIWPMAVTLGVGGVEFLANKLHRGVGLFIGFVSLLSPLFCLHGYPSVLEQIQVYSRNAPAHETILWIRKNLPRGESIAAMSGDVWKGRLFLTPEKIQERLERFKAQDKYHMGLEYNLGNIHMYEFMLKVVEADTSVHCFNMRYLDGKTAAEMEQQPRRQTIYWIEDIQPYEKWKNISGLPEQYFLFVEGMDIPPDRETDIRRQLNSAGEITASFPPFYLYSLKLTKTPS